MRKHLLSAITALALTATAAFAQSGTTITGRVTSDVGAPLVGASVFIAGTNIGATAGDDGSYTFVVPSSRATGATVTLTARVIGYTARSVQIALTPGATINQNFALPVNPFHLGEVVVTGAGTTTTRERLGVTINRVDSSALRRSNEPQNVVAALAAKAPNVNVRTQSGEPGAGASVVIRGEASLTGTNQPLFVVDGQPIDNQTVSPATMATGVGSGSVTDRQGGTVTTNRAADVNPADIESIEILKGSAAAAIYGARAANGVVLITTKRGRSGPTRISHTAAANPGCHRRWRHRLVVDRLAVDDEQQLVGAGEGCLTTNHYRCASTGLAGLRAHVHVRRFCRQRGDHVLRFVRATQCGAVDAIDRHTESLARRRRACARHHHFAEVERVDGQRKVLVDGCARRQRDLH